MYVKTANIAKKDLLMKNLLKKIFKQFFAFTLAEVVLVMGIIGVVGVLAISNARNDTDEAEKIAQLRKTYEILDTAFANAVAENGIVATWGSTAGMWNVVSPYMKFMKKCGTGTGCWANKKAYDISGTQSNHNMDTNTDFYKGILVNGVSIAMLDAGGYVEIMVDVNGPDKGLNKYGDDIFDFEVSYDTYYSDESRYNTVMPSFTLEPVDPSDCYSNSGTYCTAWAIKFGNMDYLKTDSDGKCSNGKTLKWTITNSSTQAHSCKKY